VGSHEGWYSTSDESFYTEEETKFNSIGQRRSIETGNIVEWVNEMNYKFKLAKYIPKVREWLATKDPILPKSRVNDLKSFLDTIEKEHRDLSVSRTRTSSKWGIPVPGNEEDQLIYVWLDALTNYLTVSNYPKVDQMIHIVGKDILK
jgi:methionyl-tRNA synthetase